ncbi:MAG: thymidylate synthase [Candidatus Izemoplasmatales bacterium]|nr:thymidylate synthase [Candidatus Izemoplasmatales bacterium]
MSYADKVFIKMCEEVLSENNMTECRAIWKDTGDQSSTISKFGVVNRYDLRKEFPILTQRPVPLKSAIDEILWIYQKKSNNIKDLNSHVWDDWADENGSIGAAYGYQIGSKLRKVHHEEQSDDGSRYAYSSFVDQTDYVLHELKYNPFSRRIITNMFNVEDTHMMGLEPCAFMMNYKVTIDEFGRKVLNAILYQRSQDILTANGWNVAQYAALVHMFAQVSDMIAGEFMHVIADAHIYDRHVDTVKDLIKRPYYDAPELVINPEIKNFYDFTPNDFQLVYYHHGDQIKGIDVAV